MTLLKGKPRYLTMQYGVFNDQREKLGSFTKRALKIAGLEEGKVLVYITSKHRVYLYSDKDKVPFAHRKQKGFKIDYFSISKAGAEKSLRLKMGVSEYQETNGDIRVELFLKRNYCYFKRPIEKLNRIGIQDTPKSKRQKQREKSPFKPIKKKPVKTSDTPQEDVSQDRKTWRSTTPIPSYITLTMHCCGAEVTWFDRELPNYCPRCGGILTTPAEISAFIVGG